MIGLIDDFDEDFKQAEFNVHVPKMTQEMDSLLKIIGDYDGWIIGDPASKKFSEKGRDIGCMRWGVGTNNVDFEAAHSLGIPIENTPRVFGREVADLVHYVIAMARSSSSKSIGNWFKPVGQSLWAAGVNRRPGRHRQKRS